MFGQHLGPAGGPPVTVTSIARWDHQGTPGSRDGQEAEQRAWQRARPGAGREYLPARLLSPTQRWDKHQNKLWRNPQNRNFAQFCRSD